MKCKIFNHTYITSFIIVVLFGSASMAQEFDVSKYKMLYTFNTIKQHDNTRELEVSFKARNKKNKKDKLPVYDAEIKFMNILNDEEVELGATKTNKEGIAKLIIPENQLYLTDQEGFINLVARFEGTDALDKEEKEIRIRDVYIKLTLSEIDSVKTVLVKAFTMDSLGEENPVEEADLFIAVGGMLSKMKLVEGTIENGEFEYEFPTDIPGDVNGDLIIYSIIEDHEEFGNVEQKETANWGIFHKQIKKDKNTLWSSAAPMWMYIVLTIMLVGVWLNYLYTIVNLIILKKEGDLLELNSEEIET